jgi:predicted nucleotidyltransferase
MVEMQTSGDALARAKRVRAEHERDLLSKPNVVGVGIGMVRRAGKTTSEIGIIVMVEKKVARIQLAEAERVPGEIDGVRVDVQEVGEVRADD